MNFFKRQYRVLPVAVDNRGMTVLDIGYIPQVKYAFSFTWRNLVEAPYNAEYTAWLFIDEIQKLPKPITYEQHKQLNK